VGGRSGGEDVVNQDDIGSVEPGDPRFFNGEGVSKIREPLMAVQLGLGARGSDPLQSRAERKSIQLAEVTGQFVRLVPLSPLLASPMKGDRDDEGVFVKCPEASVFEAGFLQILCQVAGQIEAALIFKQVDEFEGLLASFERSAGEFEIERQALAIGAAEVIGKVTIEDFAAVLTEGFANSGEGVMAALAKRGSTIKAGFTEFTNRRVDEIEDEIFHFRKGSCGWVW